MQYDMKNPFLTDAQKVTTEAWYQFPIGIFFFAFFSGFVFFEELGILGIVIYSYLFGITIAILNWRFYFKPFIFSGYIFGGNISSAISIAFAVYFGFEHRWILMILAIFESTGLLGIVAPSTWLYTFLSKRKNIHPKYFFADRYFKISQ